MSDTASGNVAAGERHQALNTVRFFSPIRREFLIERYGIALATAALAIILRWIFDPLLGHVAFYVTVYVAVAFCSIVCGYAPAIVSAIVGFLGIFYFFVDPRYSLSPTRPAEIHGVVGWFFVCTVLIVLGENHRQQQFRLRQSIAAMISEASERRRAEAALQRAHHELENRVAERTGQLTLTLNRLEGEVMERKQAEEQLRQLSVRLMTLQDEERRHIARDLHDTTGQTLAAMKMTAALIQRTSSGPEMQRLLDDLNALTDEAVQEIRTTSYLLHPPLLDEAGIASAMQWFVEGFSKRSGIQVHCEVAETLQRPPRNHELVLFRVLQESLTNVHRHSSASATTVRLNVSADHFVLQIADNGTGIPEECMKRFREAGHGTGVGLVGMRERVHELGGHLDIQSNASGTTVTVALPATISKTQMASLGSSAA
ncbi:MAG TPA: sensor histidine kinase [Terriglobales bacterium]|jgi:signal transduction histidine kinase|nr:sensor histidine kinase [Terriglobales bacterium]